MGAGTTLLIGIVLVLGAFFYIVVGNIKAVILLLILAGALLINLNFEERNYENQKNEISQKWQDFTVKNSCGIFEKNEKAGTISWKCADGIIYTKPDSILNGAK